MVGKRSRSKSRSRLGKYPRYNNTTGTGGPANPPSINISAKIKTKLRFVVQTTGNYAITAHNIADLLNFPTAAGATAYRLTNAYRIRAIEFWAPPSSSGQPVSVQFQWVGNTVGAADQSVVFSDTALGQDKPAHIRCVPPRNTSHANWQVGNTATVCQFGCVVGTLIDLTIEYTLSDVYSAVTATTTVPTTGAVNQLCCKSLDGLSTILPIGWTVD